MLENADENAEESAEENVDEKGFESGIKRRGEPKQVSFEIEKPNVKGNSLDLKHRVTNTILKKIWTGYLDSDLFDYQYK